MKKEFIFIGPPGSGKGTQTIMLAKDMNLQIQESESQNRINPKKSMLRYIMVKLLKTLKTKKKILKEAG